MLSRLRGTHFEKYNGILYKRGEAEGENAYLIDVAPLLDDFFYSLQGPWQARSTQSLNELHHSKASRLMKQMYKYIEDPRS